MLIGVKGLDALRRATVQTDVYDELAGEGVLGVFVFAGETYSDDAHFAARMFHHRGFREDPATGSANTAFARASAHARGARQESWWSRVSRSVVPRVCISTSPKPSVSGGKVRPVLTGRFDF